MAVPISGSGMSSHLLLKCKWSCSGTYLTCTSKVSFSGTCQVTEVCSRLCLSIFHPRKMLKLQFGGLNGEDNRSVEEDDKYRHWDHKAQCQSRDQSWTTGGRGHVEGAVVSDGWWWEHYRLPGRIKITSSPLAEKSTPDTAAANSTCWWVSAGLEETLSMWVTTPRFLSDAWGMDNEAVIGLLWGRQSARWTAAGHFLWEPQRHWLLRWPLTLPF